MKNDVFIVIPKPPPGLFPRLVPELGKPIRARKFPSRTKTFYLFPVYDPEEKREKTISVYENECWEAEVTVTVRRKT